MDKNRNFDWPSSADTGAETSWIDAFYAAIDFLTWSDMTLETFFDRLEGRP